jgi:hypothetical protein
VGIFTNPGPAKPNRVMHEMLMMNKIDIAVIEEVDAGMGAARRKIRMGCF